jgi:ABC-type dipeptide/oligopeptide/nickel transport system permease component
MIELLLLSFASGVALGIPLGIIAAHLISNRHI